MNRCDHCDAETVSPTNLCLKCLQSGHRSVEHCLACKAETDRKVALLNRTPADNFQTAEEFRELSTTSKINDKFMRVAKR